MIKNVPVSFTSDQVVPMTRPASQLWEKAGLESLWQIHILVLVYIPGWEQDWCWWETCLVLCTKDDAGVEGRQGRIESGNASLCSGIPAWADKLRADRVLCSSQCMIHGQDFPVLTRSHSETWGEIWIWINTCQIGEGPRAAGLSDISHSLRHEEWLHG